MQCKDIDTLNILKHLNKNKDEWHMLWESEYSIVPAFPPNTPEKLIRAKMSKLINKDYVEGCSCGCRGDFYITQKGINLLKESILC